MKKLIFTALLATACFSSSHTVQSQDWQWEWASTCTKNGNDARMDVLHTDLLNQIFCRTKYGSEIQFPDTAFTHNNILDNVFCALSKNDNRGSFINALEIYPYGQINNTLLVTDSMMNIYLTGEFRVAVLINGFYLPMSPNSNQNQPDIFVARFTPEYDLVWSGLISGYNQDMLNGMVVSEDNYIYIACTHVGAQTPGYVNYLDQDSSAIFNTPMMSVIKIDLDGNLIWKQAITSPYLGSGGRQLYIGNDGLVYFVGRAYGHLIIGNDTIFHPYMSEVKKMHFMTVFDPSGEFLNGFFFDWDIWVWETQVNSSGDIYVSGTIKDTVMIGNDTIIIPPGKIYAIAGRFTPQLEPVWYQYGDGASFFRIFLDEDNLLFVGTTVGNIQIGDTTISIGNHNQVVAGEFNTDGQLINFTASQCSGNMSSLFSTTDNCRNLIIGGGFKGTVVIGSDTITSKFSNISDGFVAKLVRNKPGEINIGDDTTACDEFVISAPDVFKYYLWNGNLTKQSWHKVTESGIYTVGCANEDGCWVYDTIQITIDPLFAINLGQDTTILLSDTLILTIPHGYDSYLWYDGSTENSIMITGAETGTGMLEIWVEVTHGTCVVSDTLLITVKDPFGIDLVSEQSFGLSPNPFTTSVIIEINPDFRRIEIYDVNGILRFHYIIDDPYETFKLLELGSLTKGVYLIRVIASDRVLTKKLIKM